MIWGGASPSRPLLIAHRGASEECVENTEAAAVRALESGADAVECDVQLSRDGVPVVLHDPDLLRLTGSAEVVADLDASELIGRPVALSTGSLPTASLCPHPRPGPTRSAPSRGRPFK